MIAGMMNLLHQANTSQIQAINLSCGSALTAFRKQLQSNFIE
jgi:hypothetical protein